MTGGFNMKKTLFTIISLLCAMFLTAQELPYPTDTIKGKIYYRYPVQKGEGLYRISKNFNVSQEDIVRLNPELQKSGLKLGQVILIPAVLPTDSTKYIVHELQPKETLYGVSRMYGVKIAQIEELNPETSKTMRIGEKLLIPKTSKSASVPQKTEQKIEQTVEKSRVEKAEQTEAKATEIREDKEDKHIITQKADISADAKVAKTELNIDSVNDNRTAELIKKLIEDSFTQPADSSSVEQQETDSLIIATDSLLSDSAFIRKPIQIAVLLPLMTDAVKRDAAVERFMEFYEGLLLAVNKAQADGQHFIIRTFDTDKTESRILTILADSALLHVDAIVGPAYQQQVALVADYAKQHQIPAVIPFTSKVAGIDSNPWLLQFNPNEQTEAATIAAWAEQQAEDIKCIFFTDDSQEPASSVVALNQELSSRNLPVSKAPLTDLLADSVDYIFDNGKLNLVVLPSDKYNACQTPMLHLSSLSRNYKICLVSEYTWQKENINLKQFYTYLFDSKKAGIIDRTMYKMMRKIYFPADVKTESPRYDLLGYDLTSWLIGVLEQQGATLDEKIQAVGRYEGLQSDLEFTKASEDGGWMNKALMLHSDYAD